MLSEIIGLKQSVLNVLVSEGLLSVAKSQLKVVSEKEGESIDS